jgi:hypothetical protein
MNQMVPGYTQNMISAQQQAMQSIYASQNPQGQTPTEGPNLGSLFKNRMASMMQQLSQYVDLNNLQMHASNIKDATKAQKIHQFANVTNAQMDAQRMQADFKMANSYLQVA